LDIHFVGQRYDLKHALQRVGYARVGEVQLEYSGDHPYRNAHASLGQSVVGELAEESLAVGMLSDVLVVDMLGVDRMGDTPGEALAEVSNIDFRCTYSSLAGMDHIPGCRVLHSWFDQVVGQVCHWHRQIDH
jgi:hypothetical protein